MTRLQYSAMIGASLLTVLWVGPVSAESGPSLFAPLIDKVVARIDGDGDGHITRQEFEAARNAQFDAADGDGDRQLDLAEFQGAWVSEIGGLGRVWADQAFAATDRNADRHISKTEIVRVGETVFSFLDRDGDGRVTRGEIYPSIASASEGN